MGEKSGYGNMKNKLIIQFIYSYFLVFYIYIYSIYICICVYIYISKHLLHGLSQCCGTLHSLAWAFQTSGGELLLL